MTLAEYLVSKGINPTQFAAEVGVPASTITRILNGKRMPRLDTIQKIVAETDGDVTINDFVTQIDPEASAA
jgi:predicted transcriptional regulator